MANYPGIYKGADYGFESTYEKDPFGKAIESGYRVRAGQIGLATDVRLANQLKEVSDKLNTGAKTLEVSGISTQILESIPDQHLREIARLKKLAGADLTFHGPLVEPTGFNQQQGAWDPAQRENAERQMWDAIKRGQQMMMTNVKDFEKGKKAEYEDGNLVVTLHTSNGLIGPKTVFKKEGAKEVGVEHGEIRDVYVIDEYTGKAGLLPDELLKPDVFEGEKNPPTISEAIRKINNKMWNGEVANLNVNVEKGTEVMDIAFKGSNKRDLSGEKETDLEELKKLYKLYKEDSHKYSDLIKDAEGPDMDKRITYLAYGEGFIRDAYDKLKVMYAQATNALEKQNDEDSKKALKRLKEYRDKVGDTLGKIKDDPLKIREFAQDVGEGMRILGTLPSKGLPQQYKPIEEFAVDKGSETFANVAYKAYREFGEKAPILSIENPPVGMGLSRADELRKLVEASRDRFKKTLMDKEKMSEKQASDTAQKLIGVTWDVGHINMLKKYGFDDKDIVHETEKIKPLLKHVHLSDNFGMEHTELPMGMGNVPMKGHMAAIGEKIKEFKHIVETGDWYQHFKTSPLPETFAAFGSPLYPMAMQPYWDQAQAMALKGSYFGGYGMNPDIHHSIYGAGFSNLPMELGGQMPGNRNRLSGNPLE